MTRPLQGALIGFGFIAEKGHVPAYLSAPDLLQIEVVADREQRVGRGLSPDDAGDEDPGDEAEPGANATRVRHGVTPKRREAVTSLPPPWAASMS